MTDSNNLNLKIPSTSVQDKKLLLALGILVFAAVLITHLPALDANALTFDDDMYLTENQLVQNPGIDSASRFMSEVIRPSTVRGYYQPLAMISIMIDYALGGREGDLMAFHRTSLILHGLNTILVMILLYQLFGNVVIAAGLALLFGLHPMRVETIAWVGERKTVLSAFFALISLISYVKYSRTNCKGAYFICLLMYVLSMLSKPISVPLPCVMLLMDYWPLNRPDWKCIKEKIPFFVMAGIFAIITYFSQKLTAIVVMPSETGPMKIIYTLCHNIIFYLHKMVWPASLSLQYDFPDPMDMSDKMILIGVIGTCILIPALVISLRWTRAALTGWLIFFVAIFPTMQIIGFSNVIAGDKYTYLPKIGLLMTLAAGCVWLFNKFKTKASYIFIVAVIALGVGEAMASRQYLVHWRDTMKLYRYALTVTEDNVVVHYNIGLVLGKQNKLNEAKHHFRRALEILPAFPDAENNLGNIYLLQGDLDNAIIHYQNTLDMFDEHIQANYNLGMALSQKGKFGESEKYFIRATELAPDLTAAYLKLAIVYENQNKIKSAINTYKQILKLEPLNTTAKYKIAELTRNQK